MIVIGLTGSIAMGKSTISRQFAELGAVISNSDEVVHGLLENDAEVIQAVTELFPSAVCEGKIDRSTLGKIVFADDVALKKLEAILHPKVRMAEEACVAQAKRKGAWLVVLDIPLLFETHTEKRVDKVVVVTAPYEVQKSRVLARPGMTEEKFEQVLRRQVPDEEKRRRADFIVHTDKGMDESFAVVKDIVKTLKQIEEQKRGR